MAQNCALFKIHHYFSFSLNVRW